MKAKVHKNEFSKLSIREDYEKREKKAQRSTVIQRFGEQVISQLAIPPVSNAPAFSSSSCWLGLSAMTCTVTELREMVHPTPGGHTLCVCMCFFTLDFCAKARPHTMHWNGFSPVWLKENRIAH